MYSIDAAIALAKVDVRLDFIYLDANHSYDETKRDLRAWSPLINSGGMIAGHDYLDAENNCGSRFGVKSAVDEFVEELGLELVIVPDPWPSWYFLLQ
jgi:cephalosporin hydroxylase